MSDEFDADKMLEELDKLETDETLTSLTPVSYQFNYEVPDGTIIDTNCNCSGGGPDTSNESLSREEYVIVDLNKPPYQRSTSDQETAAYWKFSMVHI